MSFALISMIIVYFLSSCWVYFETVKLTILWDKELVRDKSAFSDSLSRTLALYTGTIIFLVPTWFHAQRLFIEGNYFIIDNRLLVFTLASATCLLVSSTITYPIVRYKYSKLTNSNLGVD